MTSPATLPSLGQIAPVEPQHVVPGYGEPADWWLGADTAMRAMPIVAVQPDGQFGGAFFRGAVRPGVGPFAQAGLDEAFCLAVGSGRVGPGAQMLDFEPAQRLGVAMG
jgi:hypothetical protein